MSMDFIATALLLFLVLDPLGNIPLFLAQLRAVPEARRRHVVLRELGVAYLVLLFFLFAGAGFMKLLALDVAAVNIAGGLVLFLIALRMIFPVANDVYGNTNSSPTEPFIVPLAIPAVAGPGALGLVLLLREAHPDQTLTLFAAISTAWLASAAILAASGRIHRLLKEQGIVAMARLMGLVLVMIAVQMFIDAWRAIGALPA